MLNMCTISDLVLPNLTLAISNYCTIPVFITHNYMSFDLSYCELVDNIADNTK